MLPKMKYSLLALSLFVRHVFAQAPETKAPIHITLSGIYGPETFYTFQPVPFTVPIGCTSIEVIQAYDKDVGNSLDLGIWDQRGTQLFDGRNQSSGFRGWSGGAKTNFTISPANASTGYIAGAIEPGTWFVMQGPYVVIDPGIHWQVNITLGFEPVDSYFQPNPAAARVGSSRDPPAAQWYRGDLHVHTVHSDGGHTPAEVVGFAKDANLNFFVSTDHNTNSANLAWGVVAPSDMLIIEGIEVTTRNGHWQAIGLGEHDWVEYRYRPGNVPGLPEAKAQVHSKSDGVVSINHPFITCAACNWTFPDWDFDTMEIWNGFWDETDEMSLVKWQELLTHGNMIGIVGGSDFHNPPVIVGFPTTIVRADAQTKASVVDGIRRHRVVVVYGPGFDISLCVRVGHGACADVGDRVQDKGAQQLEIGTTGMKGGVASVWTERGKIHEVAVTKMQDKLTYKLPNGHKWARVEVRNDTSMLGLTNIVFLS